MQVELLNKPKIKVAVVGVGYWGRNLVRNFLELGALEVLCDAESSVEVACSAITKVLSSAQNSARSYPILYRCRGIGHAGATHYEMAKQRSKPGRTFSSRNPVYRRETR